MPSHVLYCIRMNEMDHDRKKCKQDRESNEKVFFSEKKKLNKECGMSECRI